jgi:type I restriction enzyme S subunit
MVEAMTSGQTRVVFPGPAKAGKNLEIFNEFKETEIGLIPVDWDVIPLAKVVSLSRKPRSLDLSAYEAIPFVPMELIPDNGVLVESYIPKQPSEIRSGTYFERGDILLAKITPSFENGKQGITDNIPTPFGYATTEVYPLQPRPNQLDRMFLFHYLKMSNVRAQIAGKMEGTTGRQRVPKRVIETHPIPLPPLPEQRRIAHVLNTIQREIAAQDALIAAAREVKRSLMQRLFTYGPGAEPASTKETEIGEIPEHWEVVQLGKVAKIRYGLGQPPQQDETGVPMIRATNIKRGRIFSEELLRIQVDSIPRTRDPFLKAGDIIVVRSGAYTGDVAMVTHEWEGCIAGYDLIVSPSNQMVSAFCTQYLLGDQAQTYFKSQSTRSAQSHINSRELADTLIPIPALSEQHAITHILSTVDRKIAAEEQRKAALQALFKSMLHQLMTGQLRLTQDLETQRRKDAEAQRGP